MYIVNILFRKELKTGDFSSQFWLSIIFCKEYYNKSTKIIIIIYDHLHDN